MASKTMTREAAARLSPSLERQKNGEIGDFGGGSLEHPRPWLGVQWLGLTEEAPSCPEPPGAP